MLIQNLARTNWNLNQPSLHHNFFMKQAFVTRMVHRCVSATHRYILGKGVIPAQERFKAVETFNPTYELTYWYWALNTAQQWRERLHLPRVKKWDDVLKNLSLLPVQNGVYLATESATDSYTNPIFKTDHPSVLGAFGMTPKPPLLDTAIMHKTF